MLSENLTLVQKVSAAAAQAQQVVSYPTGAKPLSETLHMKQCPSLLSFQLLLLLFLVPSYCLQEGKCYYCMKDACNSFKIKIFLLQVNEWLIVLDRTKPKTKCLAISPCDIVKI